jgi:hypothetical protein
MKVMCESFDFANMALIHGDYKVAEGIFETIKNEGFKSREIFLNLATAQIATAIEMKGDTDFVLPLQIDISSRLRQDDTRGLEENEIESIIEDAIQNLERTIKIDPDYFQAYLNLSIAYWLKEDKDNYSYYFMKASKACSMEDRKNLILFEAIIKLKSNSKEEQVRGISIIDSLSKENSLLARKNMKMVKKISSDNETVPSILGEYKTKFNSLQQILKAVDILQGIFIRDLSNSLSCKEKKDNLIYRKWKYSKDDQTSIIQQNIYFPNNRLSITDKEELRKSAQTFIESSFFSIYMFNDVIIKVFKDNSYEVHILKS